MKLPISQAMVNCHQAAQWLEGQGVQSDCYNQKWTFTSQFSKYKMDIAMDIVCKYLVEIS